MRVRRLDRYVASQFLFSWAIWLCFMLGLMIIFELFSNLDKFAESAADLPQVSIPFTVIRYYATNSVFLFLEMAPFITVTAAMFTVARMVKHNEMTAMIMTGTSVYRILVPIFVGAILVGGLMVIIRETALPALRPLKEQYYQIAFRGEMERVGENLVFTDSLGRLVTIDSYLALSRTMEGMSVLALGELESDWERYTAERAVWSGERGWTLEQGLKVGPGPTGEIVPEKIAFMPAQGLDPDLLEKEIKRTREFIDFSYSELLELARLRPDYMNFQVLLHYHVTFPIANVLLLLLALPFGVHFERKSSLEGVIMAIAICAAYLGLDYMLRNLGGNRMLNPVAAAWVGPVLFGSAGVAIYGSMRT